MSIREPLKEDPRSLAAKTLSDKLSQSWDRIEQIRKMNNAQLVKELIAKVWAKENIYTENFDLLEEAIERLKSAQQMLHLTAIAACGLGVLVGLFIGWLWFGA
jgi:flagellar capping protein FliD